jgi:hypothetical protein
MLLREVITVYHETHTKHINMLYEQNAELFNVKGSGTYSNHCASKG